MWALNCPLPPIAEINLDNNTSSCGDALEKKFTGTIADQLAF